MRRVVLVTAALLVLLACSDNGGQAAKDLERRVARQLHVATDDVTAKCPDGNSTKGCAVTYSGQRVPLGDGEDGPIAQAIVVDRELVESSVQTKAQAAAVSVDRVDCGERQRLVLDTQHGLRCRVQGTDGSTGTATVIAGEDGRPTVVEIREQ